MTLPSIPDDRKVSGYRGAALPAIRDAGFSTSFSEKTPPESITAAPGRPVEPAIGIGGDAMSPGSDATAPKSIGGSFETGGLN